LQEISYAIWKFIKRKKSGIELISMSVFCEDEWFNGRKKLRKVFDAVKQHLYIVRSVFLANIITKKTKK